MLCRTVGSFRFRRVRRRFSFSQPFRSRTRFLLLTEFKVSRRARLLMLSAMGWKLPLSGAQICSCTVALLLQNVGVQVAVSSSSCFSGFLLLRTIILPSCWSTGRSCSGSLLLGAIVAGSACELECWTSSASGTLLVRLAPSGDLSRCCTLSFALFSPILLLRFRVALCGRLVKEFFALLLRHQFFLCRLFLIVVLLLLFLFGRYSASVARRLFRRQRSS